MEHKCCTHCNLEKDVHTPHSMRKCVLTHPTESTDWRKEYCKKFGLCALTKETKCQCAKELKFISQLLSSQKEKIMQFLNDEKYDEDVEDIGAEVIADHAYKDKFEAFRFGYNEALKNVLAKITAL